MNCPDCQSPLEENSTGQLHCPGCQQLFDPHDFTEAAQSEQARAAAKKQALENTARGFTVAAGLSTALSGIGLAIALKNILDKEAEAWPWWFAGACLAGAAWLYIIGQIVYIRATLEK